MHRFFVEPAAMTGDRFPVPQEIAHQVTRVLRLRDGDAIALLDGAGGQARCRLVDGACVVEARGPADGEPRHRLTVWQALLRGDHLEPVVRHGTEVGVARFALMTTERCIARDMSPRRLERLRAVAREAAEQSERGIVPQVEAALPFAEVLAGAVPGSVLLFERDRGVRLSEVATPPGVFIGPEGGFSADEVGAARDAGMVIAGLGPRILRSETVAVAVAAVILSRAGDFA